MGEARQGLTLAFAVSLSIVREAAESYCEQEPIDLEAFNQNVSNMVRSRSASASTRRWWM